MQLLRLYRRFLFSDSSNSSHSSKATAPFTSGETQFAGVHEEGIVAPLEIDRYIAIYIFIYLYNNPGYSRILIGSRL